LTTTPNSSTSNLNNSTRSISTTPQIKIEKTVTPIVALGTSILKIKKETNPPPPVAYTPSISNSTPKIKTEYQVPQILSTIPNNTTISNTTRITAEKEIQQERAKKRKLEVIEIPDDDVVLIEYYDNNIKKQRL